MSTLEIKDQNAAESPASQRVLLQQSIQKKVESPALRAFRRFLRHRPATVGFVILLILALSALFAPMIQRYPPEMIDLDNRGSPPSAEHWLGTDRIGRDIWSRAIHAGRISLSLGTIAALITATIGTILGSIAGFMRGMTDALIMRLVDLLMTLPDILILLILVMYLGPGLANLMIILPALGWAGSCRLMRGQVLAVRELDYILAGRCLGYPTWRILLRHVLPNAFTPILVSITLGVGSVILAEAGLSFLGLGVQPPTPSWGNMLNEATNLLVLQSMPWIWLPPALLVVVTVLSINFVGDGLRDAIDPRMVL